MLENKIWADMIIINDGVCACFARAGYTTIDASVVEFARAICDKVSRTIAGRMSVCGWRMRNLKFCFQRRDRSLGLAARD